MDTYDKPDIEARPIDPFPAKPIPIEIDGLPAWIASKPPDVSVSIFERGAFFVYQIGQYSKIGYYLIRAAVAIAAFVSDMQEKKMGVLKVLCNLTKWAGVAVGAGGFASGWIGPELAAVIAGASYVLGNVFLFVGDYLDDKKINQSFDPSK